MTSPSPKSMPIPSVVISLAGAFLVATMILGLFAPILPLADPYIQVSDERLMPPSSGHWLGTDDLGRDLLSRAIWGARTSLTVGLVAVSIAFIIGVPVGIVGGYVGGWTDRLLTSVVEILMAVPGILLALVMIAILGPSLFHVMIAVGVSQIPQYARQVRASTMALREQDFIIASRLAGARPTRVLLGHILPNVLAPVAVLATMGLGSAILEAAALSFLGLSGDPNRPEWGSMLNMTRERFLDQPWLVLVPGLAITGTVLAFNVLGDSLRDWLDPKTTSSSGRRAR